jgi:hypothetical protein
MLTPVGMLNSFYFITLTLTCRVEWSKLHTCMPSVKTIWLKKTTYLREMLTAKALSLIPSSKLSLNPL